MAAEKVFGMFGSDDGSSGPPENVSNAELDYPQGVFTLFFAFRPAPPLDAKIVKTAALLDKEHGVHGKSLRRDQLHISLHAIGSYRGLPPSEVAFARRVGESMSARAFDVVFDRTMTFGGNTPRVLCVSEDSKQIQTFWQDLGIAIANAGRGVKTRKFSPHMTVSYGGRSLGVQEIEPIHMKITELFLLNSHYGEGVHEILGQWPLIS
ncbi:MAG: RNA 2',3'-cyclic phosphodiesterase [Burkholderiales bacterium PBB4]|nr:MAG: RNA 2',3'-cyclic phosphodiesterase [Burkholderiales bacterium PBB4]